VLVAADQIAGDLRRVRRVQRRALGDRHHLQLAVAFDLRRTAGREDQVADSLAGIEHRADQRRGGDRGGLRGSRAKELRFSRRIEGGGHVGA
jgi:hypothetical protein